MNTRCLPFLFLSAIVAACGGPTQPTNGAPLNAPAKAVVSATAPGHKEAIELFESLCFTCHGMTGHGDGPGAGALNPKPRSFADVAWQDSVTDEGIQKTIVFGGAAVGKSPMMPAQPQLKGKKEVLEALTRIVREFRGK